MAEEAFFFGCPVLQRFIRVTEPLVNWDLYDSDPWDALKGEAEAERPPPEVVRRRALLCVAFSFEEIGFSLKKLKHHGEAEIIRAPPPGPIRGPSDLDALLVRIEEVSEDVVARLVNHKMMNTDLGAGQVTTPVREGLRNATNIARSSVRLLQAQWNNVSELAPCGAELAHVLEALKVSYDRRLGYFKAILGESNV